MALTIQDIATFCKKKGFVYQSSEIYGGMSGFWDFGHLGVELFNNLNRDWWKFFVQDRDNMVGMDASIISHPRIWKASGHLESFGDTILQCTKCKEQYRADLKHDSLDRLHEIQAPTLITVGSFDVALPPMYGREVADAIPNAEFYIFTGGGHLHNIEHPEEFNEVTLDFLRKHTK